MPVGWMPENIVLGGEGEKGEGVDEDGKVEYERRV